MQLVQYAKDQWERRREGDRVSAQQAHGAAGFDAQLMAFFQNRRKPVAVVLQSEGDSPVTGKRVTGMLSGEAPIPQLDPARFD